MSLSAFDLAGEAGIQLIVWGICLTKKLRPHLSGGPISFLLGLPSVHAHTHTGHGNSSWTGNRPSHQPAAFAQAWHAHAGVGGWVLGMCGQTSQANLPSASVSLYMPFSASCTPLAGGDSCAGMGLMLVSWNTMVDAAHPSLKKAFCPAPHHHLPHYRDRIHSLHCTMRQGREEKKRTGAWLFESF